MKITESELKERIEIARDELRRKRSYLQTIQKEVEEREILLEYYESELKRLQINPSSRVMK